MSTEDASFVVAVEISAPFEPHVDVIAALNKTGAPCDHNADRDTWFFRAPVTTRAPIVLKPGLRLHGENEDILPDNLPPLPRNFIGAIYKANQAYHNDEPDDEPTAPTPEDLDANAAEQYHRDEPGINAEWSGRERQHEPQPATNAAPKKGAISLGELLESEDSSDATICAPLGISFGDRPMLIVGAFGTAKTWVMIKLALEFATGCPLFGNSAWPINRPLRVFIFDYELNRRVYKKRLRELCETIGIDYQTIRNSIYYYERPKFFLTDPNAFDRFLEESKDFDVILGDALRGAAPDVDENKSEFRKNLDILHDVATAGNKFVCWLHHAGKDESSRFRGTSGIGDAAGVMFIVTNDNKDRRGPKKLHHEKLGSNGDDFVDDFFIQLKRDGEDGKGPMRITYVTEEESKEKPKAEIIEKEEWGDTMRKVLIAVKKHAGRGKNELYKVVGGNRRTFDTVLRSALKKGRVENRGTPEQHKYHIAPPGQQWLDEGDHYTGRTPGPNAPTTPNAPDDAPFIVETEPEQAHETSAKKNQSDAADTNVKMVVKYIRDNPGCTTAMIDQNAGIKNGKAAKAARDTAKYQKVIRFDGGEWHVTQSAVTSTPNAPASVTQDEPATPDTTNGSTDPTKGA